MVRTVLEHEHVLLSAQEIDTLDFFRKFCCRNTCTLRYIAFSLKPFPIDNTRYCLVRLVLRKPNQWHAISTLQNLEKEIGEEGLQSSIADLCQPINGPMDTPELNDPLVKREFMDADALVKVEEDFREIIDLTWDAEEVEDHKLVNGGCFPSTCAHNAEAGPSRLPLPADPVQTVLESNPAEMNLGFFCEDENNMTLEDILWRLHKDQLLELAKSTRCKLSSKHKV
jgi:fanconi-associated nuclease 1